LKVLLVVALVSMSILAAVGQSTPVDPSQVGDTLNPVTGQAVSLAENQSGEDVSSDAIDLELVLVLDVDNAEVDLTGALLGGGKAQTDLEVTVNPAIYAVSVSRLETALNQSTERSSVSANGAFGLDTNQSALTAKQIRQFAGGQLL